MSRINEISFSSALAIGLPSLVFTRSGSSLDPQEEVWEWTDGPFDLRIDFRKHINGYSNFVPALKHCLIPFLKGNAGSYVENLEYAFRHFTERLESCPDGAFTSLHISNYAAKLDANDLFRLGTLSALLQKWVDLELPGVKPECANYLAERRKPGNKKGEAVRTRNPVDGPLSEEEYTALYSSVNAAYGRNELPLWTLLLTRLLLACGGRISQYASLKIGDFDIANGVLKLPQAKTGAVHMRASFLEFDITPQTGSLMAEYVDLLQQKAHNNESAFFPESVVMINSRRKGRPSGDLFFGYSGSRI